MLCQHDTQFHCYFAFCLKSPEYHVNQNELLFTCSFDIFLDWIVSRSWFQTSGIFTSRAFIRRCWNTFIYKFFIYIVLKTTDKKNVMYFELILTHIYFQKRLGWLFWKDPLRFTLREQNQCKCIYICSRKNLKILLLFMN